MSRCESVLQYIVAHASREWYEESIALARLPAGGQTLICLSSSEVISGVVIHESICYALPSS